jgi:hypothetical protein
MQSVQRSPTNQGLVAPQSPHVIRSRPCSSSEIDFLLLYGRSSTRALKGWLSRSSQELRYQAARLGSMHSYRQAATTLHELLGVDPSFGFLGVRKAVLQAGSRLDQEGTIAHRPDLPPRAGDPPSVLRFAFDGGYARRTRKGPHRNFEIVTGACEKNGKIRVFATAYKSSHSLRQRLSRFVGRVGYDTENPTALMTDGAESLLRLKALLPVPTRLVLDYFHVAMKVRHADQCIGRIPPYRFAPEGSVFELYNRFNYLRGYLWSGRRAKFKESFDRLLYLLDRVQYAHQRQTRWADARGSPDEAVEKVQNRFDGMVRDKAIALDVANASRHIGIEEFMRFLV